MSRTYECKIDFRWEMEESDFLRLREAVKAREEDNMYGKVLFGKYSAEICPYAEYIGINLYHLGVDSGYGYTKGKGTPYDYEEGPTLGLNEPLTLDLKDFKKVVEQRICDTFFPTEFRNGERGWLPRTFIDSEVKCPLADWT